jgi:hypothetical protein
LTVDDLTVDNLTERRMRDSPRMKCDCRYASAKIQVTISER